MVVSVVSTVNVTLATVPIMLAHLLVPALMQKVPLLMDAIAIITLSVYLSTVTPPISAPPTAPCLLVIKYGDLMLISVNVHLILSVPLLTATAQPTSVLPPAMVIMQWVHSQMVVSVLMDMNVLQVRVQAGNVNHSVTVHRLHLLSMVKDANVLKAINACQVTVLIQLVVLHVWAPMPTPHSLMVAIASMVVSVLPPYALITPVLLTVVLLPSQVPTASAA